MVKAIIWNKKITISGISCFAVLRIVVFVNLAFLWSAWCQFHQHFKSSFFNSIFMTKNYKTPTVSREKLRISLLHEKAARKMLMKFTSNLFPFDWRRHWCRSRRVSKPSSISHLKVTFLSRMRFKTISMYILVWPIISNTRTSIVEILFWEKEL